MKKEILVGVISALITAVIVGILGWFFKGYLGGLYKNHLDSQIANLRKDLTKLSGSVSVHDHPYPPGDAPVGTIIAWHKSLKSTPILPGNWLECNGQIIFDTESPYYQGTVPDINGRELFIRGSNISGTVQEEDWKTFSVNSKKMPYTHALTWIPKTGEANNPPIFGGYWMADSSTPAEANGLTFAFDQSEVRPKNFSVVWIIKIK